MVHTPTIDKLRRAGVALEQHYVQKVRRETNVMHWTESPTEVASAHMHGHCDRLASHVVGLAIWCSQHLDGLSDLGVMACLPLLPGREK